jgi:hypothetical protein
VKTVEDILTTSVLGGWRYLLSSINSNCRTRTEGLGILEFKLCLKIKRGGRLEIIPYDLDKLYVLSENQERKKNLKILNLRRYMLEG